MKKKIVILLLLVVSFVLTAAINVSLAQTVPEFPDNDQMLDLKNLTDEQKKQFGDIGIDFDGEPVMVANVNFYDAKILNQDKNKFEIEFKLGNQDFVQSGVTYGVELIKPAGAGESEYTVVDSKSYDEVLSFSIGDEVTKKITYQAPEFLLGQYTIRLVSYNQEGLMLALWPMNDLVTLSGQGDYVYLDKCTVNGDNFEFSLLQGVDIKSGEEIYLECSAMSSFDQARNFSVKYSTFERSINTNNLVGTEVKGEQSVASGNSTVKIPIHYPEKPQAYDVEITLVDEKEKDASNSVIAHYVLRGNSASITNLTLDKDGYLSGEEAQLTMFVSGRADQFSGSRYEDGEESFDGAMNVIIKDGNNNVCAEKKVKLESKDVAWIEKASVKIERDCSDPHVFLDMLGKDGESLYKTDMQFSTREGLVEKPGVAKKKIFGLSFISIIWIVVVIIFAVFLRIRLKRKHSKIAMFFLVFLFGALMFFSQSDNASAASYYDGHVVLTINWPAPGTYPAGSNVSVSSSQLKVVSCQNFIFKDTWIRCGLNDSYSDVLKYISCNFTCTPGQVCKICADYSTTSKTFTIPSTCRNNALKCDLVVYGGVPGNYEWGRTLLGGVNLGNVNCPPVAKIDLPVNSPGYIAVNSGQNVHFKGRGVLGTGGKSIDRTIWIDTNRNTDSWNRQACNGNDGTMLSNTADFYRSNLSVGEHRICLSVRQLNQDGMNLWNNAAGTAHVTVNVRPCTPQTYSCKITSGDPAYCTDPNHCDHIHSVIRECEVTDTCGAKTTQPASVCVANGVPCEGDFTENCPACDAPCEPIDYSCNVVDGDPNYCSDDANCEKDHTVTRNCRVTDTCGNVTTSGASVCRDHGVACEGATTETCGDCPDTTNWIEVTP